MNDKLPKGWVWTNLEDISEIILGQSPPSSTYNEDGTGLPFYQGKLEFGKIYPTPKKWCTAPKKIAEKGDVLISVRAPVGPTNICPEKSCIGRGLAAIRGLGGIETLFLLYLVRSFENVIAGKGTGTTFKAIAGNQLRGFRIPLPPLPEQHRIVAKIEELLTKLDVGVESLKKAKVQLKRYRQSIFKEAMEGKLTKEWRGTHKEEFEPACMLLERIREERKKSTRKYKEFSPLDELDLAALPDKWLWTRLGQVCDLISGQHIFKKDYNSNEIGIPYITGPDDFTMIYPLISKWTEKPKALAKKNDVLVTVKGAGVGKVNMLNIKEAAISRQLMAIRGGVNIDSYYIFYLILSKFKMLQSLGTGSTIPGIDREGILNIEFPLPPLPEQHKIVEEIERRLSVVEEVEATIEANLKRANRLRQSILNQAFLGKLVPQDPNDEPASVLLEVIRQEKVNWELEAKEKSKVISRSKNMRKLERDAGGEKQTVDLCDILRLAKKPLEPKELWLSSELDIEDFYAQLKEEVVKKERIIEHRPNNTDVFLELRI